MDAGLLCNDGSDSENWDCCVCWVSVTGDEPLLIPVFFSVPGPLRTPRAACGS